jgi:hypothetical protein
VELHTISWIVDKHGNVWKLVSNLDGKNNIKIGKTSSEAYDYYTK